MRKKVDAASEDSFRKGGGKREEPDIEVATTVEPRPGVPRGYAFSVPT